MVLISCCISVVVGVVLANLFAFVLTGCFRAKDGGLHLPQVNCGLKIVDQGVLALDAAIG